MLDVAQFALALQHRIQFECAVGHVRRVVGANHHKRGLVVKAVSCGIQVDPFQHPILRKLNALTDRPMQLSGFVNHMVAAQCSVEFPDPQVIACVALKTAAPPQVADFAELVGPHVGIDVPKAVGGLDVGVLPF